VLYPAGHAIELVPLNTAIDPGADAYTYRVFDYTGQSKRSANMSEDAPRVDIAGFEVTHKLHSYRAAYGYSIQQMRAAAMANLPLEQKDANAAREVQMRKLDNVLWFGDSEVNVTGLANNTLVSLVSPVTGTWSSATGLQMLADLQKLVSAAPLASKGVERPDTVAMSITQYEACANKPVGDNVDKTVLDFFRKANPHIKNIVSSYQLELADAGGTGGRLVAYANNGDKLEGLVPVEFEQFPAQAVNMAFKVDTHLRAGGVAIRYPGSVKYMDGC
jgi:hypothetical protein